MNRKLYVGITSFFAVIFTISITFLPYYNPIYFYLQHISLFLFMAMFIYYLLKLGYDRLQKRVKKTNVLKGYTITIFIVLLFLFSNVQLYAIETYQTSEYQSCSYYDQYGNAIYYSQLTYQCPEIEIIEQDNSTLAFTVVESTEGNFGRDYDEYAYVKMQSDIIIEYFSDGTIKEVVTKRSANMLHGLNYNLKIYNSFMTKITNIRIIDPSDNTISTYQSNITFSMFENTDFDDFESVEHYNGNDFSTTYYGYTSNRNILDESNQTGELLSYQIVIEKHDYEDDTFTLGTSEVVQVNDVACGTNYCHISSGNFDGNITGNNPPFYGNDKKTFIMIYPNGISHDYEYYRYTENDLGRVNTIYNNFDTYDFVFYSEHNTLEGILNLGIDRMTFKYLGNQYLEHGDFYSVFHETEYGTKIVRRVSTMDNEQVFVDSPLLLAATESGNINTVSARNLFKRVHFINDYGIRLEMQKNSRHIDIIYQKNPLIFTLLKYQE